MTLDNNLPNIFRTFRSERHISIRSAAQGLAAATISRFENGTVELNADFAFTLMTNIGLDAEELDFARNQQFPEPFAAFIRGDRQHIYDQAMAFLNLQQETRLTNLIKQSLTYLLSTQNPPKKLEQQIVDRLAYPLLWGNVEATLLIAMLPTASLEFLKLLWSRIGSHATKDPNWQQLTVAISAIIIIARGDDELRRQISEDLTAILQQNRHPNRIMMSRPILVAGIELAHGNQIDQLIRHLCMLKSNVLAHFLTTVQTDCANPHDSWHHLELKDNFDKHLEFNQDATILTGPTLSLIRKQRGLTLNEVVGDWSVSTQSRFESGKVAIGFTKLLMLLDKLMIPLSRAIEGKDMITSFEHLQRQFANMGEKVAHYTKADFFDLVDQFDATHSHLTPALLQMETYAVRSSIGRFAPSICTTPEELEPHLSATTQDTIIAYINGIAHLSHLDAVLLKMVLQGIDKAHIRPLTSSILAKLERDTPAERVFFENVRSVAYGPLYWQYGDLLRDTVNHFQYRSQFDSDWRIQRDCYFVQLLADSFEKQTEMQQFANSYMDVFRQLVAFPDAPFMANRWLQFAIDRDYQKLEN